jgi:hypothetical protein
MGWVDTFWVSGTILFDLETGGTKPVLMLVNRVEDATIFKPEDAKSYLDLVSRSAKQIPAEPITWTLEPSEERPGRFVIKGVQNA